MIVGIVAGIASLGTAIWFFWRRHKRAKAATYAGAALANSNEEEKAGGAGAAGLYKGPNAETSELHNEEAAAAARVSPVSAGSIPKLVGSELAASPKPGLPARKPVGSSLVYGSELGGTPRPIGSELAGSGYAAQGNEFRGNGYGEHNPNLHEAPWGCEHVQPQNPAYGYQGYGRQPMYGENPEQVYEMPSQGGWQQNARYRRREC